jgi:hypothetical protein
VTRTRRGERGVTRTRRGERGVTMVMAVLTMAALLVLVAGGLVSSSASLRTTHNYGYATQALFVAESGVLDAVKTINGPGVVNYETEVAESWSTVFGGNARTFSGTAGYSYTVLPVVTAWDAADAGNRGTLRAVAVGPQSTTTAVVARVTRSNIPGTAPGAIYIANDNPTDADFDGNSFVVDGNDRNYTGGTGSAAPVPGIATRNAANAAETIASMNAGQLDNVTGLGFNPGPPVIPSVQTAPAGPSQEHINQIIDALLERPHSVCPNNRINNSTTCTYGTTEAPQITHLSNPDGVIVQNSGNVSGAGILIVEGGFRIQGTVDFRGLILVRGPTEIDYEMDTDLGGNATVYGSLWTTDLSFEIGGSAIMQYSSQALALANQSGGGGALPAPVTITSLLDCSMVAPGTNGCP